MIKGRAGAHVGALNAHSRTRTGRRLPGNAGQVARGGATRLGRLVLCEGDPRQQSVKEPNDAV